MVLTPLPAAYLPVVFHSTTLDSYTHPSAEDMVRPWAQEAHSTTDLPPSFEDPDHDDVELPELFDLVQVVLGVEHLEMAPQENTARHSFAPERRFDKTSHLIESPCDLLLLLGPFLGHVSLPAWLTNFLDLVGSQSCPAEGLPLHVVSTLQTFLSPWRQPDQSGLATLRDKSAPSLEFAGCSLELPLALQHSRDSYLLQP